MNSKISEPRIKTLQDIVNAFGKIFSPNSYWNFIYKNYKDNNEREALTDLKLKLESVDIPLNYERYNDIPLNEFNYYRTALIGTFTTMLNKDNSSIYKFVNDVDDSKLVVQLSKGLVENAKILINRKTNQSGSGKKNAFQKVKDLKSEMNKMVGEKNKKQFNKILRDYSTLVQNGKQQLSKS